MIKKVLVANRGEIALRIFRTCREMGIGTVAVASEADRNSLHVMAADECVEIGPPEPTKSYLLQDRIIEAARQTGADAIHPGYGFLSENADFAERCEMEGITFIGPPAPAMRKLGAKIQAKQLAVKANVPVVPGKFDPGARDEELKEDAEKIGYPVLLKASAGGGGRGMRAVHSASEFDSALKMAREEAMNAFGDGAMMVEKLIERPRHIEVQILADKHGNVAALYERECSLQRRHQKLVEEAPSPVMTEELWQRMRDASISLAKEAGYVGAGTVEFIANHDATDFYFMEVNARLQVEHPVTEAITGVDLVRQQILVAEGNELSLDEKLMAGDRSAIHGHSIEVRIVAEDPAQGFLPSTGPILGWAEPRSAGVRFDSGFGEGSEVSRFYDSMLAKLITHGADRDSATRRLEMALQDTHVLGVQTNIGFLLDLIQKPDFDSADFDTKYIEREMGSWSPDGELPSVLADLAATAGGAEVVGAPARQANALQAWSLGDSWRA